MIVPRLIPVIVIALALTAAPMAPAAIYKCRGPHGHWLYSDHKPGGCRSHLIVLGIRSSNRPAAPAQARRPPTLRSVTPPQRQSPPAPTGHWRRALSALKKTPVPHNPGEARLRQQAVLLLESHLGTGPGG